MENVLLAFSLFFLLLTSVNYTPVPVSVSPYSQEFILTGDESHLGGEFFFPSNKDGTFGNKTAIGFFGSVDGLAIGDFNNDGNPDFLLGEGDSNALYLYINNGNGVLTPTKIASGLATSGYFSQFRAADFNNDGFLDFVGGDFLSNKWWFKNNGDNTFTKFPLDVSWNSGALYTLDVGDFNKDENMDIVMVDIYNSSRSGKVFLYRGNGAGGFTHTQVIDFGADTGAYSPLGLASGDFNNDGNLDLIIGGDRLPLYSTFWLYKGDGTGRLEFAGKAFKITQKDIMTGEEIQEHYVSLDAYDIDHNGNQDLIAYSYITGKVYFIGGNGDGTFQSPMIIENSPTISYGIGIAAPNENIPRSRPISTSKPFEWTLYQVTIVAFALVAITIIVSLLITFRWHKKIAL